MDTSTIEDLAHVDATLSYIVPTRDKPRALEYGPPPGVQDTPVHRDYAVTIRDVRPVAAALSLEREGFQLVTALSEVRDFYDEEAVRTRYYGEAVSLLEEMIGASRVVPDKSNRR